MEEKEEKKSIFKDNKFYYFLVDIILYLILALLLFAPSFYFEANDVVSEITYGTLIFGGSFGENLTHGPNFVALAAFILIALSGVTLIIAFFTKGKVRKGFFYISIVSLLLSIIANILITYLFNAIHGDLGELSVIVPMCILSIGCPVISFSLSLLIFGEEVKFKTRDISEIAMLVALAIVLDKLKIQIGATGGSFNFAAVPLMIIGIRHGYLKGLFASSIVFGLITNLLDGYGIACYPFDYLIAFAGYPICGLVLKAFKKSELDETIKYIFSFLIGGILMFVIRMIGSTMSSMILWEYDLLPALSYNVLYIGPSALGATILAIVLSPVITTVNKRFPVK